MKLLIGHNKMSFCFNGAKLNDHASATPTFLLRNSVQVDRGFRIISGDHNRDWILYYNCYFEKYTIFEAEL